MASPRSHTWLIPEPTYHLIIEQSHNRPSESFHLTKQKCVSLCKAGQKVVVGGPQPGGDSQPQRQREEHLQCLVDWSPWVLELLYPMEHQFSAWGEDLNSVCLNNPLAPSSPQMGQTFLKLFSAPRHLLARNTCHNRKLVAYTVIPKHMACARGPREGAEGGVGRPGFPEGCLAEP